MLKLDEQLKKGEFSRFHLIYGEETYLVRYYKNALKKSLSRPGDEMNCSQFYGAKTTPEEIYDVGQILPFFAPNRLIIVQGSKWFKNSSDMAGYMDQFPDTTYIVFVESEVDGRNSLFKWMKKNGCVTECKKQRSSVLIKWADGYVKRAGKTIDRDAVQFLLERVGLDMEVLAGELEKLIGYSGERARIGYSDVEKISSGVAVSRIFDLMDAVAEGDRARAIHLYDDLVMNREPPMRILFLFTRHVNILIQIKELTMLGLGREEQVQKIRIPPFTFSKYSRQAERFTHGRLMQMLENSAGCEADFKTGKIGEQISVEMFLIQALTNV